MEIERILSDLAREALLAVTGLSVVPQLRPTTDPKHGDYQVNNALSLAKELGKKPRDIAEPLAARLAASAAIERAEVAGPGFVNLTLRDEWLARLLTEDAADHDHDGVPQAKLPLKIVIDFSSPNIAKQMHVGHLRSTIIGQALVHLMRAIGHQVNGVNHIGDWGTQYGLLLMGMRSVGDLTALENSPVAELERVYKWATARAKEDESFAEAARAELARLQSGHPENLALWEKFVRATRVELDKAYTRLGVNFDSWRGESAYNADLDGVVRSLENAGLARLDQGAKGIFWQEVPAAPDKLKKQAEPFLIQKKDGAFLYATTDIAALLYRVRELGADEILYVVDSRQAHHFEQLFAVGQLLQLQAKLEHISFGTVLDEHGKPLKTRDGVAVTLASLLDEAEARAKERVLDAIGEGKLKVAPEDVESVAQMVGIGAVKYADLRQNRRSDYQFDWEKMVSFQGNAGPYMQYAHARICSVFDKAGVNVRDAVWPILIDTKEARDLVRSLSAFGGRIVEAAETRQPHLVCDHLYDLARAFMAFYEACPILKSEGALRESRLTLAGLTARQLQRGLALLGIQAPERM